MRLKLFAILLLLINIAVLVAALPTTALTTIFEADAPNADSYLANVYELERNEVSAYHWTTSGSALLLPGFERLPVVLDLYMTSPRPVDEPAADLGLGRGRWVTQRVAVQRDWRHYHLLVPASDYQPELSLISTTFRPDQRNDKRNLGVALGRVQISVPALLNPLLASALSLGPWRIVLLLLLPLLLYSIVLRLSGQQRSGLIFAFLIGCVGALPIYLLGRNPIQTAVLFPDAWRLPLLAGMLVLLWLSLRPWLGAIEQHVLMALNNDRLRPIIVVGATFILGLSMLLSMPAWEHPDESSHFEFAWLIAHHPTWPTPGTSDPRIADINGGGRALHHQPLYHILISLILRLCAERPIVEQLLLARAVSLMLFLGIALTAEGTARTLFPAGHLLRWFAPLALVLNPTFANLMTSVNNDVGVVFICSLALMVVTQVLMQDLSWPRALLLLGSVPLAMLTKNTGAILLAIVPLVLVLYFWRRMRLSSKWFLIPFGVGLLIGMSIVDWSDPRHWYRWQSASGSPATRVERTEAPLGPHVLRMNAVATRGYTGLSAPLSQSGMVANHTVTVGAWVWASRPAHIWAPGVIYEGRNQVVAGNHAEFEVSTQPRWVATSYRIPPRVMYVHLMAWSVAPDDSQPLDIYIDGAVMVIGTFSSSTPPQFEGSNAQQGTWDGQPFQNLIRNGSFEEGWFFLRPQIDQLLATYLRRSPTRIIASFADPLTTLRLEIRDYIPWMMFTSFGAYGGRIFLREHIWQYIIPAIVTLGLAGLLWLTWRTRHNTDRRTFSGRVLGCICLAVWGLILVAHLPVNFPVGIPSSRYGFTIMMPSMILLCVGWLTLWPKALHYIAAASLIVGLIILDCAAIATIRLFENSMCIREPMRCIFSPAPLLQSQPMIMGVLAMLILLPAIVHWYTNKQGHIPSTGKVHR